jgi:GAF domain-containing protein
MSHHVGASRDGAPEAMSDRLADVMAEAARSLHELESIADVLNRLVQVACTAVPGAEFAGVSLARHGGIETVAASDPLVGKADQLQYELGEGPCLDAMAGQTPTVVIDMNAERRWPRFAPRAVELGVRSQMGIEIFRDGPAVGGLNLYAGKPGAFDDTTQHAATLFAVHAAIALDKTMTVTDLTKALQTRQTIGQAVGIVMHRYTVNEHAAFQYLVRVSQNSNIPLREVARTIVSKVSAQAGQHRQPAMPPVAGKAARVD